MGETGGTLRQSGRAGKAEVGYGVVQNEFEKIVTRNTKLRKIITIT